MRWLEMSIVLLIGVMPITIFIEQNGTLFIQMLQKLTGIIGVLVISHNLYLYIASVLSRPIRRDNAIVNKAPYWVSIEPIVPIMFSFFINIGTVIVAVENVYDPLNAENVGNTNFAKYLTV